MEPEGEVVRPTLIALRQGDPVVEALGVAGPGSLVIVRVLPMAFRSAPRRAPAAPPIEPGQRLEALERTARAQLAGLVGRRRPPARLVIRFGDVVEQVAVLAREVRPSRVIAAGALARRLARAVGTPVVSADQGGEVRHHDVLAGLAAIGRRALRRPPEEKLAALRRIELFRGVGTAELRRLASLLDLVEVGPGHVLVAQGRRNDMLCILLAGSAARRHGGSEVGRLGPHAVVGAPSLIYEQRAIATVTTLEPTRALVAGRAQFQGIKALDSVALRLRAATADCLRDYLGAGAAAAALNGRLRIPPIA